MFTIATDPILSFRACINFVFLGRRAILVVLKLVNIYITMDGWISFNKREHCVPKLNILNYALTTIMFIIYN